MGLAGPLKIKASSGILACARCACGMDFPTREEWLDPSLLLRREHAMPKYVGGEVAGPVRKKQRRAKGNATHNERSAGQRRAPGGGYPN